MTCEAAKMKKMNWLHHFLCRLRIAENVHQSKGILLKNLLSSSEPPCIADGIKTKFYTNETQKKVKRAERKLEIQHQKA